MPLRKRELSQSLSYMDVEAMDRRLKRKEGRGDRKRGSFYQFPREFNFISQIKIKQSDFETILLLGYQFCLDQSEDRSFIQIVYEMEESAERSCNQKNPKMLTMKTGRDSFLSYLLVLLPSCFS
jgi:hypothetical protein